MSPDIKRNWSELNTEQTARAIVEERTPHPSEVIIDPTIRFLDPDNILNREERARVIALGDRTAISYDRLAQRVINDRLKPPVNAGGEETDATASFFQMYALAARSTNEIAHGSILEQANPGPSPLGGDSPIIFEGVQMLPSLRDICLERHAGFEAFSSRGGVIPPDYWRIPDALKKAGAETKLTEINQEVYSIYLEITEKSAEYFLNNTPKKDGETGWQYRWRILSYALDVSRQVLNGTFLNHFSMHPNSALALRESVIKLSASSLPETRGMADKLRDLAQTGLPTLMRHTEPSPYTESLDDKRKLLTQRFVDLNDSKNFDTPHFEDGWMMPDPSRLFLAAFLANNGEVSYKTALKVTENLSPNELEEAITLIFKDITLHDKPPVELEMIQATGQFWLTLGALYDLGRHRGTTFIKGKFIPNYGYVVPDIVKKIGMEEKYHRAIGRNHEGFNIVKSLGKHYDSLTAYYVCRADILPVAIRFSGLDMFHILKLRADEAAHPDVSLSMFQFEDFLKRTAGQLFNNLVKRK